MMNDGELARFSAKYAVDEPTGHWLWTGRVNRNGYGEFDMSVRRPRKPGQKRGNPRYELASRLSYEHFIGQLPAGQCALHSCDMPACIAPDHLFSGTQADNNRDMYSKGRQRKPENNPNTKLDHEKSSAIRAMRSAGDRYAVIADRFGISESLAGMVCRGKRWCK